MASEMRLSNLGNDRPNVVGLVKWFRISLGWVESESYSSATQHRGFRIVDPVVTLGRLWRLLHAAERNTYTFRSILGYYYNFPNSLGFGPGRVRPG